MSIAILSSYRSKDNKTQNGACIVDSKNKIVGIGYNGLPRGCDDNDPDYWRDEDDNDLLRSKHSYVVHAEKNAIYNCMAHDITGSTMYVTQFPCNTCAQALIQVGIKMVVFSSYKNHHETINIVVKKMFDAAGVAYICFNTLDIVDGKFLDELNKLRNFYE